MASVSFNSETGVVIPSTSEVREDLATALQTALRKNADDPEINVDSTSPLGQFIDLITAEIEAKNAEIAFLASQLSPRQAEGLWLDQLAALYGLDRKASEPTVVVCTCTGLKGTVIPYGAIVQDTQGNQLRHTAAGGVSIPDGGSVDTSFATVEHGDIEIGAGTVTKIVTVVAGWDSVTNEAAGVTGRDIEADGELYQRMLQSYAINANGTVANLQANLSQLEGVIDCVVLENYTNNSQEQYSITLTPHSVAVCIVGGEDEDIAETIYRRKSAGCDTVGSHTVTYVDHDYFDASYSYGIVRPDIEAFKIQVSFFDEDMDSDTQAKVKDALTKDFLGEGSNGRVKLATTVYASRFYQAVQGATDAPIKSILVGLGDSGLGVSVDIPADKSPSLDDDGITLSFEDAA